MVRNSLKNLALQLRVPQELLKVLAEAAPEHYRPFTQIARGKKPRLIDNPADALKLVQRRIRRHILEPLPLPPHVTGCVVGMSAQKNAEVHLGARFITSVDIKDFYPSVSNDMIFRLWQRLGFGPGLASLLTKLTTVNGHLPQGAPTSDALANHVVHELDTALVQIATDLELRLTRYLDNVDLSGDRAREALPAAIQAVLQAGFAVRHSKVFTSGRWAQQIVTGFNSGRSRVSLPHQHRARIRAAVHEVVSQRRSGIRSIEAERSVIGRVRFLNSKHPGAARGLELRLIDAGLTPFLS